MDAIQQMSMLSRKLQEVEHELKDYVPVSWKRAMQGLMHGKDIFKVERTDDEFYIQGYMFLEREIKHYYGEGKSKVMRKFFYLSDDSESEFRHGSSVSIDLSSFAESSWFMRKEDLDF